jgi:GNAT superfamily N-acetyltransferase
MRIVRVNDAETNNQFFKVERVIYKDDKNWIPHIRQDLEKIFDPKKNKLFRSGKLERWILFDNNNNLIGRIAAFVNGKTAKTFKQPTGGVGFFECINNQEAANLLFDTAKNWLAENGMEAMDGPINFGEKLNYWGLLTKNFTSRPTYGMNYNPEYYVQLFENYGFQVYYEQFMFYRLLHLPAQEVFVKKAQNLMKDPDIRLGNVRGKSTKQFAQEFLEVYNDAWGGFDGFKKLSFEMAHKTILALKPVYDPDIVIFAYHKDRPIGFYLNLPELNGIFKHVNGNLNLWGKLKFLFYKKFYPPSTMFGIIFGVVKDFQGKGVEGAMIKYAEDYIVPAGKYKDTVLTWIGDFNPRMLKVCENLGAEKYRTYATYRYLFDRTKPFERAPLIDRKSKNTNEQNDDEE